MVDAIISVVLEQLISTAVEEAKDRVRLVTGVDRQVKSLRDNFEAIQALMVDAEQRQWKEAAVRLWLEKLKHASYDMEDVLDEWNSARLKLKIEGTDLDDDPHMKKVCSFFPALSCFGFKNKEEIFLRHDIALKIKEINERLDGIGKQKDMFNFNAIRTPEKSERIQSTALINVSEVCGRDEEKNTLKSKLLCESSSEEQNAFQVISLVGMGGIGKTTLAQSAYNDNDVINNFEKMMWVCVSDPFDEFRVAKAIIEALEGSATNLCELNSLLQHINEFIAGKRFFLVLDDVWTDDYSKWEPFRNCLMNGLRGSKIMVTTRKKTVAQMMESTDIISIKELSGHECWSLFKRFAFFGRSHSECEQLEEIGRKIVDKCKGLPLAAKTIGSLLRFKKTWEEWQIILNSELWQLEEFEKGLVAPLLLSYNDLPSKIKQCFSYCAVFPKDYDIKTDELIKLWMAQGYIEPKENKDMEMIGQEYFDCLATRSFFQEFQNDGEDTVIGCKMHDIVHDFAHFLTKNECSFVQADGSQELLSLISSSDQEKLLHSMLVLGKDAPASVSVSIFNPKKLRSLLIHNISGQVNSSWTMESSFDQLKCLRALRIAGKDWLDPLMPIYVLPKSIEKLIHLRYLQLAKLDIKELPETYCELFNLQTLDITKCNNLRGLPQGIGMLVNLRHLIFDGCYVIYMPKGIERLTSLRTLSEFVVARSGIYGSKACNLDGLQQLNHLRGSLIIRGLGNVRNVDEAKNAHLEKKENLVRLELLFDKEFAGEEREGKDHEEIIVALRLPPNLESLQLCLYKGKTLFPNWIMSLNKLKMLFLFQCVGCEIMPPLGKLPSLERLDIWGMICIKRVGDEFLGIESSGTSSSIIAFPKLTRLSLNSLFEWEDWDFGKEDINIMPQLNYLYIEKCFKLKSLPDQLLRSTTMETLEIESCPILIQRFKKTGQDWSKISHIPSIQIRDRFLRTVPAIDP